MANHIGLQVKQGWKYTAKLLLYGLYFIGNSYKMTVYRHSMRTLAYIHIWNKSKIPALKSGDVWILHSRVAVLQTSAAAAAAAIICCSLTNPSWCIGLLINTRNPNNNNINIRAACLPDSCRQTERDRALATTAMGKGKGMIVFAVVLLMIIVMAMEVMTAVAVTENENDSRCDNEMSGLISNCASVISGGTPSAACCGVIKTADMNCVCSKVTPSVARLLDAQKLVKVLQYCGRPVPHHTRCGALTIP